MRANATCLIILAAGLLAAASAFAGTWTYTAVDSGDDDALLPAEEPSACRRLLSRNSSVPKGLLAHDSSAWKLAVSQNGTNLTVMFVNATPPAPFTLPLADPVTGGYAITAIGSYAFQYRTGLTALTFPDSLTSIGGNAFSDCVSLTNLTLGNGITNIGYGAFTGCAALAEVTLPDSITRINGNTFPGCSSLVSVMIPGSVTNIDVSAFSRCRSLTHISVAADNPAYKSIDGVLFDKAATTLIKYPTLRPGVYSVPGSVTNIGEYAFAHCSGLTGLAFDGGVVRIGDYASYKCTALTELDIPDSVTTIGKGAFSDCGHLTRLTLGSSVADIGELAFFCCYDLTGVTLPDSVTSIGSSAFAYCEKLTELTIPTSATNIGNWVFSGCSGLTSMTLPDNIAGNGVDALKDYTRLTNISVSATHPAYKSVDGVLFDKTATTLLKYPAGRTGAYLVPSNITTLGNGAFSGCAGLTGVTIPSSVARIGDNAFSGCTGLSGVMILGSVTNIGDQAFSGCTGLTGVTLPASVTGVGHQAFSGCHGLTSVTIPDTVNGFYMDAFSNCMGLTNISVSTTHPTYKSIDGVLFDQAITKLLQYPAGRTGTYSIPDGVADIVWGAFRDCTNLTGVTISDSVTNLETRAFSECAGLASISVSAAHPAYASIDGVLFDKTATTLLRYPPAKAGVYSVPDSVTCINDEAFQDCAGLTALTFGGGITNIANYALSGCSGLTEVTIPDNVTHIGNAVFGDHGKLLRLTIPFDVVEPGEATSLRCALLTNIVVSAGNPAYRSIDGVLFDKAATTLIQYPTGKAGAYSIPGSVTNIGYIAFACCRDLTAVTLPDSLTSIASMAFFGCHRLNDLAIPSKVTLIGEFTFRECTGLTCLTIPSSITRIRIDAFTDCRNLSNVTYLGTPPVVAERTHTWWDGLYARAPAVTSYIHRAHAASWTPRLAGGTLESDTARWHGRPIRFAPAVP